MREQLPEGEEQSLIDPTRSLLNFDQQVGMVVGVRFKGQRPADLDAERFHGIGMREAVRAVFDAMDRENEPKVTYEGAVYENKGILKFRDAKHFVPWREGSESLLEGIYRIEIGDHLTVYDDEDAVIWQGRVPLKAGDAGIDEDYLRSIGTVPAFFRRLFEREFRATLVTRDRNVQQNAK